MTEPKWIKRDDNWLYVREQASCEVAVLTAYVSRDRWEGNVWDGYGYRGCVVLPFGPDDSRFNPRAAVAALLGKELYWRGDRAYVLGEEEVLGAIWLADNYWWAKSEDTLVRVEGAHITARKVVEALVKARSSDGAIR